MNRKQIYEGALEFSAGFISCCLSMILYKLILILVLGG